MLKVTIYDSIKWMNEFPYKVVISNQKPRTLLYSTTIDAKIYVRVPLGSYCHVNNKPNSSNTDTPRTTGDIALQSQSNHQGGHNCVTLDTWKVIQCRKWTDLPTPDNVIQQVEHKVRQEYKLPNEGLIILGILRTVG